MSYPALQQMFTEKEGSRRGVSFESALSIAIFLYSVIRERSETQHFNLAPRVKAKRALMVAQYPNVGRLVAELSLEFVKGFCLRAGDDQLPIAVGVLKSERRPLSPEVLKMARKLVAGPDKGIARTFTQMVLKELKGM